MLGNALGKHLELVLTVQEIKSPQVIASMYKLCSTKLPSSCKFQA